MTSWREAALNCDFSFNECVSFQALLSNMTLKLCSCIKTLIFSDFQIHSVLKEMESTWTIRSKISGLWFPATWLSSLSGSWRTAHCHFRSPQVTSGSSNDDDLQQSEFRTLKLYPLRMLPPASWRDKWTPLTSDGRVSTVSSVIVLTSAQTSVSYHQHTTIALLYFDSVLQILTSQKCGFKTHLKIVQA